MSARIPDFDEIPELEPELEAAVWAVCSEPIDPQAIERVKIRAKQLTDSPASTPLTSALGHSPAQPSRRFVRPLLNVLAACVLLACGLILLTRPGSTAFAQALDQLRATGAFQFVRVIETDDLGSIETHVFVASDGRQRQETPTTVNITDASGKPLITLLKDSHTVLVPAPREAEEVPSNDHGLLDWLDALRSHSDKPDQRVGTKELDGRMVEGFVARQGHHKYTLWLDAATSELVQLEHGALVGGSNIQRVVMKDFQFNVTLDDALFSAEVPAGYKTRQLPALSGIDLTDPEQNIVAALKGFTQLSGGKFPRSITNWGEWAVLASQSGELSDDVAKVLGHLGAITPFLVTKSQDDYAYTGEGKSIEHERSIVFWYRTEAGTLRAIFTDFSTGEIDPSQLPEGK